MREEQEEKITKGRDGSLGAAGHVRYLDYYSGFIVAYVSVHISCTL